MSRSGEISAFYAQRKQQRPSDDTLLTTYKNTRLHGKQSPLRHLSVETQSLQGHERANLTRFARTRVHAVVFVLLSLNFGGFPVLC